MKGERARLKEPHKLAPGEYCFWYSTGLWHARTPNGHLCNLSAHDVVEHEDGTISVSPSILVSGSNDVQLWNGYLERGVWRAC